MNAEVQKLCVSFDRYMDILHCTLRVYTVICTECVEMESCNCTRKCRRTREMEKNYTSDCLKVDVWIMVMDHTYGDGCGICTFIYFNLYICLG